MPKTRYRQPTANPHAPPIKLDSPEKELFAHYRQHFTRAVRDELVRRNTGLVHYMLKRYPRWWTKDPKEDDLIAEGMMALTRSVEKFNPELGYQLSTYACRGIFKAMNKSFASRDFLSKLYRDRGDKRKQYFMGAIDTDRGFAATIKDKTAADSDKGFEVEEMYKLFNRLDDREREVLTKRFFDGQTLDEVGNAIGVTKERVRQIQKKAIVKMREWAGIAV